MAVWAEFDNKSNRSIIMAGSKDLSKVSFGMDLRSRLMSLSLSRWFAPAALAPMYAESGAEGNDTPGELKEARSGDITYTGAVPPLGFGVLGGSFDPELCPGCCAMFVDCGFSASFVAMSTADEPDTIHAHDGLLFLAFGSIAKVGEGSQRANAYAKLPGGGGGYNPGGDGSFGGTLWWGAGWATAPCSF
jgi:hypothetical protein